MILADKILIDSSSGVVYQRIVFFFQSSQNYKLWHRDHISCRWKKGKDFSEGSLLVAKEYLDRIPVSLKFIITHNEPGKGFEYRVLFPFSIVCSGGSFKMIQTGQKTELIAQLDIRFGQILKTFFKSKIQSLRIHMKEEGLSIKEQVEKENKRSQQITTKA